MNASKVVLNGATIFNNQNVIMSPYQNKNSHQNKPRK